MYSMIKTAALDGIRTIPVQVEVDMSTGMPMFDMVGNLSSEVREAKERVRTALHNCGIILPAKRITMNLSPANVKKTGTGYDLPIAVGLLEVLGLVDRKYCEEVIFVGELSLNGRILPVNGILPIVSDGVSLGIKKFVVPLENLNEAKLITEAQIYAFDELSGLIEFLNGREYEEPEVDNRLFRDNKTECDFKDVNGQLFLKRAGEIAASGMHNMLIVGPPGAGKTMISERIKTILPKLTEEEKLELSKIYSVAGLLDNKNSLLDERPFRNPHHTITRIGLTGGGRNPKPGEISLAHQGVLFLDEFPEFQKNTIEILRQPLEDGRINITRLNGSVSYPANFILLASMNPCNCGYYPDMQKCRCTESSRKRYLEKISQPLIDRIDICVEAEPIRYTDLMDIGNNESSETIRLRVEECHKIQKNRFENENFMYNSKIPASRLKIYCPLDDKGQKYMEKMYEQNGLTARTYHKLLRVSRTIADMDESKNIKIEHLIEAMCYRNITEKYWGV